MPIRCCAEQMAGGIFLNRIVSQADADGLRNFFREREIETTVSPLFDSGDHRIFLTKMTMESFSKLIEGANIELIP